MRVLTLLLLLGLAACSEPVPAGDETSFITRGQAQLTIGADGAGGIHEATAMSVRAVSAVAKGFTVSQRDGALAGVTQPILTLDLGAETIFTITPAPDRPVVHAIVTRSTRVHGPDDEVVGRFRFEDARPEDVALCVSEYAAEAPSFSCARDAEASYWRVFALPASYRGPGDPFEAIDATARRRAVLVEMRWFAPRDDIGVRPDVR